MVIFELLRLVYQNLQWLIYKERFFASNIQVSLPETTTVWLLHLVIKRATSKVGLHCLQKTDGYS